MLVNNWYHLGWPGTMAEDTVVAELDGFAGVAARHGLELDAYCLDDGWDGAWAPATGLWGRLEPAAFPGGLPALQAAGGAKSIGLWIGPFGGYGDRQVARVAWARDQGAEVETPYGLLCVAGDRYGSELARTLARWTAAGVGYWKLDGLRFGCTDARPRPPHRRRRPHRPDGQVRADHGGGPPGRSRRGGGLHQRLQPVAVVAADRRLPVAGRPGRLRRRLPRPRHESFATYIDARLQLLRRCAVPVSAIVTFSVVESEACRYRDEGESIADWERHCWLIVGRGTQHHDLYVSPGSLSEDEWAALATALAWARRHQRVLARSRMVLGDPSKGQVYGYASHRDGEAVLCLRNPTPRRRRVRFTLAELHGFPPDADVALDAVYGPLPAPTGSPVKAGRRLTVTLEPFGVVLFRSSTTANATPPAPRPG